jgi:hypothetical protein
MPGVGKVRGHRRAHVAKTDEADITLDGQAAV